LSLILSLHFQFVNVPGTKLINIGPILLKFRGDTAQKSCLIITKAVRRGEKKRIGYRIGLYVVTFTPIFRDMRAKFQPGRLCRSSCELCLTDVQCQQIINCRNGVYWNWSIPNFINIYFTFRAVFHVDRHVARRCQSRTPAWPDMQKACT